MIEIVTNSSSPQVAKQQFGKIRGQVCFPLLESIMEDQPIRIMPQRNIFITHSLEQNGWWDRTSGSPMQESKFSKMMTSHVLKGMEETTRRHCISTAVNQAQVGVECGNRITRSGFNVIRRITSMSKNVPVPNTKFITQSMSMTLSQPK